MTTLTLELPAGKQHSRTRVMDPVARRLLEELASQDTLESKKRFDRALRCNWCDSLATHNQDNLSEKCCDEHLDRRTRIPDQSA